MNLIRGAIERDPVHATVYRITLNGWPGGMRDVPYIACHFWGTRDELTIEDGVLLKGNGVCIPPELHDRTLYDLHNSHQGVEKMTHLARTNIYWPRIDVDIADYVKYCTICARHKASQIVQPIIPTDIPNGPWQELATNYFTHYSKDYLLIADPFSKYLFIYRVHSKISDSPTQHLQYVFPISYTQKFFLLIMDLPSPLNPFLNSYPHKVLIT